MDSCSADPSCVGEIVVGYAGVGSNERTIDAQENAYHQPRHRPLHATPQALHAILPVRLAQGVPHAPVGVLVPDGDLPAGHGLQLRLDLCVVEWCYW